MSKDYITKEILEFYINKGLTRKQIAEKLKCGVATLTNKARRYNLKFRGASFHNFGEGNPSKRREVKEKIANTVTTLWEKGYYSDRKNGMKGVKEFSHHNYTGHKHTYRDYLSKYQDVNTCSACGRSDVKIDVHHIDEDRSNWQITNLEPLCVHCHQKKHLAIYKTPYVTIGVKSHFDSSHNLLNYNGKCHNLHGHRYFYEVKIRKRINADSSMVVDFKDLKKSTKESIEELLDHEYLNDILPFNTTAENMVVWLYEYLSKRVLLKGIIEISLWETPECVATITTKDMQQVYLDNKKYTIYEDFDK